MLVLLSTGVKMTRLFVVLFSFVFIVGCAAVPDQATKDLQAWATPAKEEAKAGRMKWSDYYKGLYERLRVTKFNDTPFMMDVTSSLIDIALAYEAGAIDQNTFESLQRQSEVLVVQNAQNLSQVQQAQQRAAWANTLQNLAAQQRANTQFYQNQLNRSQTCNTRWTGYQWQTVCH